MNRRPANTYDSEDSSDWDDTMAESPDRTNPPPLNNANDNAENNYATVTPRARTTLKDEITGNSERSARSTPMTTPRKERNTVNEDHYSVVSPPPHLSSFKNALSDYSEVHDQSPQIPARKYDVKSQMYKVGDTNTPQVPPVIPPVTVNWDDSDADEEFLRELRQNIDKEKQKQELPAAENLGFSPSPRSARYQNIISDRRFNDRKDAITTPRPKLMDPLPFHTNVKEENIGPLHLEPKKKKATKVKRKEEIKEPVMVRDLTGKKCIYYFEEGSHHLLEVLEDDTEAFLPEKIDEVERLFKRVWREVFSILRIFTSFFVSFITEFIFYVINYVFQPLVLDSLSAIGNYLVKPLMTIVFNHIALPVFSMLWNFLNSFVMATNPIMHLLSSVVNQAVLLIQSVRLFSVTITQSPQQRKVEIV